MKVTSFFIFILFCVCVVTSSRAYNIKDTQLNNRDLWQKKIANKMLIIQENSDKSTYSISFDRENGYRIEIELVYVLLEQFGEYISKLAILIERDSDGHLKKAIASASQHCEHLQYLFVSGGKNVLNEVKKPFYNVTSVGFQISEFETHSQSLNEMFPNIQRLELMSLKIKDDIFNVNLPNLDHLEVANIDEKSVGKLIEKNFQLKFLYMGFIRVNLVKLASKHLPILETLILPYNTEIDCEHEIHFKNVKHFEINQVTGGLINIKFEQLEELKCNSDYFPNWISTVEKNPNLKKLAVETREGVEDEYILSLIEVSRYLIEANFDCGPHTQVETIVKFLKESKQIQKLQLNYCRGILSELKSKIPDIWNLRVTDLDVIFIEKK
ncbi:uncharacterized protein LOC116345184 [Contarinia nasturtii]|uniref:uncharacterized protein LOC116345184 n=1 Tax=Contarinia nasturtii TaxID=265458 RepID=UPI0012D3C963|nr:uncharacterized protein LOC116345184 [Contarinia nasturtii]